MVLLDPKTLLIKAIQSGDFVLFLGAGASMEAGLPSWKEGVEKLGREILSREKTIGQAIIQEAKKNRLLEAAELFYLADITNEERAHCLTEVFGKKPKITDRIKKLVKLPCRGFVTTNYDRVILEAASKVSLDLQSFGELSADLASARLCRSQFLVRLHGRIEVPESLVLSKSHYQRLPSNEAYPVFVQSMLSDATIIFFGFSFQDPYFSAVLETFAISTRGRAQKQGYALLSGPIDPRVKKLLDQLNILVVSYESQDNHEEGWKLLCGNPAPKVPITGNVSEERLRRQLAAGIAHLRLANRTSIRQEILQAIVFSDLEGIIPDKGISQEEAISRVGASLGLPPLYDSLIKSCIFDLIQNKLIKIEGGLILKGIAPVVIEKENEFDLLVDSILARNSTRYGILTKSPEKVKPALREFLVRIMTADGLALAHSLIRAGQCGSERIDSIIDSVLDELPNNIRELIKSHKPGILSLFDRPQPDEQKILDRLASTTFVVCTTLVEPSIISNAEKFRESQVFLDTSIVLPWICEGHPIRDLYKGVIDSLFSQAQFPAFYLNELVAHRALAIQEFQKCGYEKEEKFLAAVRLAGIQNLNAYIGGYAGVKGNGFTGSFNSYLAEYAPFVDENGAKQFIEKKGLSVLTDKPWAFYDQHNLDLIERDILSGLTAIHRERESIRITHDAKMIAILKDAVEGTPKRRDYFVTADKTLFGVVANSNFYNHFAASFVMPHQAIGMAQLISSNREAFSGMSRVLWGIQRSGVDRIREYYIDRVLGEYEPLLVSELPKVVEKMIFELKHHERFFQNIYESDTGGNVGKAVVALDQFESKFHEYMAEARQKAGLK